MSYKTCGNCETVYNGNSHKECPICDATEFDFTIGKNEGIHVYEERPDRRVSVVIDYERQRFVIPS